MKKFLLSAAIILVGGSAAFVSQSFKSSENSIVDGYRIDNSIPTKPTCVNMHVECSTTQTQFKCEDAFGNKLWELVGTSCPNELYRP